MLRIAWFLLLSATLATMASKVQADPCSAHAQDPITTDRPQVTNSSIVVPCGGLQFENGIAETGNAGQRTFDLPETSIRIGVAGKTELRIAAPGYFWNDQTSSGFSTGLGDTIVGFKAQLGPVKGFDVSLIPSVSMPTGARAISSGSYDPSLQLPWSRALSKSWTAAGMFSLSWPTQPAGRNLTGQASAYFDRQLTQPWDAYVEYSGSFPQRGGPQHQIGFGTAYKISPHQQLDFHCNVGLSAAVPDHSIGIGYSFRLQAFRK